MNVEEKVVEYGNDIARHNEQIRTLFEQQKEIRELAKSTNNLALAVEKLAEQFKNVDSRICAIEDADKYKANIIWACVVTGVIGSVVTFVVTKFLG